MTACRLLPSLSDSSEARWRTWASGRSLGAAVLWSGEHGGGKVFCAALCAPDSGVSMAVNFPEEDPGSPHLRSSRLGSDEGSRNLPAPLAPTRRCTQTPRAVWFSAPSSRPQTLLLLLGLDPAELSLAVSCPSTLPPCPSTFAMLRGGDRGHHGDLLSEGEEGSGVGATSISLVTHTIQQFCVLNGSPVVCVLGSVGRFHPEEFLCVVEGSLLSFWAKTCRVLSC